MFFIKFSREIHARLFICLCFMIFIILYIYSYVYLCIYSPSYEHFKAFPLSKFNSETSFLYQLFKENSNFIVKKSHARLFICLFFTIHLLLMNICMYACTYIHTYIHIYVCMGVCMYLCMYLSMYVINPSITNLL